MTKIIRVIQNGLVIANQALIQVDMDVSAERLVIQHRNTLEVLQHVVRPPSGILKVIVPMTYATSDNLLIGIMDDSGEYDCKFTDGVRAEIVDAYSVDMSQ